MIGLSLALCLALASGLPATRPVVKETVVAVLDFEAAGEATKDLGRHVALAIAVKLERQPGVVLFDRMSLREALEAPGATVTLSTEPAAVARIGREVLDAAIVVWGRIDRRGDAFTLRARALNLTGEKPDLYVDADFPAAGFREIPFAVQRIVNAIRRDADAPDPALDWREPGPTKPDPAVLARPNLVRNGDFEKGDKTPDHWEPVNGLTSFWVDAPGRPGKCIMFDTDVNDEQWVAWNRKFTLGTTDPPPAPIRGRSAKYETVAGLHGAWLYTLDYIPVEPGKTYRLSFDFRGPVAGETFFAKVFVKGYARFGDQKREVYRMYKACRTETAGREWEHFTRTFNPTALAPTCRWMRVELFTYWPPATYYFDNIHLSEEP